MTSRSENDARARPASRIWRRPIGPEILLPHNLIDEIGFEIPNLVVHAVSGLASDLAMIRGYDKEGHACLFTERRCSVTRRQECPNWNQDAIGAFTAAAGVRPSGHYKTLQRVMDIGAARPAIPDRFFDRKKF
jgi:hypothetical protein